MILHFSHIFFTDGRTFIGPFPSRALVVPIYLVHPAAGA
jgi:hypothetical protein